QKEKELLGLMLDGIIAIMKNNFAAVTQDKKNEGLVGYLKDFKIVNNNIYQVFPEKFLKSMLYNSFIVNYGSSPGIKPKEYLDYIKEVVPNRVMSDYFSAQFFANSIRNIEKKEADSIFAFLKASVYSDQILQNVYVKVNKTYKSNFPLPVLELLTKNKNVISTTSFRGKLLLIDVWALWCGPCMAAKPYLDSLEIFYKNAPELKVLRVSIDQDKNQWLKAVTKEKLNDYWVEGGFKSEFCEALNVTSIPRFIVVNELGIVIDPNAPGPKDKALFTLIDKELVRIRSKGK
ncbi:TlpA family protein disulfide reductase, partial [bacterium]